MKKYYSDETKNQIVWEYLNGKSISEIHTETGISRSTIYIWIESQKESFTKTEKINLRDYRELVAKCEKQQKIIQILKESPCTASSPLKDRYNVIKTFKDTYCYAMLLMCLKEVILIIFSETRMMQANMHLKQKK